MCLPTPDLWLGIRDMFWHEEGCTIDRRKPLTQESAGSKGERGSSNAFGGPIGSRQAELFVACTSIYQRGSCIRALPKILHCMQQLCKRQCLVAWLPEKQHSWPQPHIAQTFRHCSSSCKDQLNLLFYVMHEVRYRPRSCCVLHTTLRLGNLICFWSVISMRSVEKLWMFIWIQIVAV